VDCFDCCIIDAIEFVVFVMAKAIVSDAPETENTIAPETENTITREASRRVYSVLLMIIPTNEGFIYLIGTCHESQKITKQQESYKQPTALS
jgi:hypothetical protein